MPGGGAKLRRSGSSAGMGFPVQLVMLVAAVVASATTAVVPSSWQAELDGLATDGVVGVTAEVGVGTTVWRGSSGVARLGGHRRPPVDGRFRAASVTKSFTAGVVLQLVGEGKLSLSDRVHRLLPDVVPDSAVTVRDLLGHTSGIPEYGYALLDDNGVPRQRWRTWTAGELVRTAFDVADPEPPGTFRYSNTDYVLLGMVVERVTGRSYRHEITRRVLRPLRLGHTDVPGAFPFVIGPHAAGYLLVGDVPVEFTAVDPTLFGAAGEIVSTTADLNGFYAGLLGGRLLRASELDEMKAGLGLERVVTSCGRVMYGHGGGVPGYNVISFHSADSDRRITVSWTGRSIAAMTQRVLPLLEKAAC